jgi:UPF0271 protein
MVRDGAVVATDGSTIRLDARTICLHGDTRGSGELARQVRAGLEAAGVHVLPLRSRS